MFIRGTESELQKETLRLYKTDMELLREFYPPGYGNPGINGAIREIVHSWVNINLRGLKRDANEREQSKQSNEKHET